MIVAGEASGDMHGAGLVRAMHRIDPALRFSGMGGRELRAAGVEILVDAAGMAVVGAVEVLSHLGEILRARRSLIARLHSDRPDLLILIDYPDFNLLLAARAKTAGHPHPLLHQPAGLGLGARAGCAPSAGWSTGCSSSCRSNVSSTPATG